MLVKYTDPQVQVFIGDAQKLDQIQDKSIDLVLIDPPYGISYVTGYRNRSPRCVVATDVRFDPIAGDQGFPYNLMRGVLYEAHRVLKQNTAIYIFTRFDAYPKLLPTVQEMFTVKNVLTWCKNNWSAGDLEGNYAYQTEVILFCTKGKHLLRGRRDSNLLCFNRVDGAKLLHPAEKPVNLLSYLISKSTEPGGVVLDPMCGSGSVAEAAIQMGRKAILVDIEEKWINTTINRIGKVSRFAFPEMEVRADFSLEMEFANARQGQ